MGPAGQSIQGDKGEQGPQGNPAPTSEVDDLKRRLAAAEAQLDLIFGDQELQPLKLGETQLRFVNRFTQGKYGKSVGGEIENYGEFDAVNVVVYLRFRNPDGAALAEGWFQMGTIRSGEVILFRITTGYSGSPTLAPIHKMDYQFLYSEGGEAKIGGEGNIRL